MISGFLLCLNEEELLSYALESFESIADLLDVVSIVDNGSTDASLDIVDSFRTRLPIALQIETSHCHHGYLRNLALAKCRGEWVYYLDADETHDAGMREWLASDAKERGDIIGFMKYSTIIDRYHYTDPGAGISYRLFRNLPGVCFDQSIHTYPQGQGLVRQVNLEHGPYLFDATSCKSEAALWSKGFRYGWANRLKVPAVGPSHEYTGRRQNAFAGAVAIREFTGKLRESIFTGPLCTP